MMIVLETGGRVAAAGAPAQQQPLALLLQPFLLLKLVHRLLHA